MRLNQVTLPALDIDRSVAFYTKLGLKLIVYTTEYARFELPEGGSTLSVHRVEAEAHEPAPWIYFECSDLDDRVAALKADGIVFKQDPTSQRWAWRDATLLDPAGNLLIMYFAGDARLNPPWRITDAERDSILERVTKVN